MHRIKILCKKHSSYTQDENIFAYLFRHCEECNRDVAIFVILDRFTAFAKTEARDHLH